MGGNINSCESKNTFVDFILSTLVVCMLIVILSIGSILYVSVNDYNVIEDSISATNCTVEYSSSCKELNILNLSLYKGRDCVHLFSTISNDYAYVKVDDSTYKVNIQQEIPEGELTGVLLQKGSTTRIYFGEETDKATMWRSGFISVNK